MKVVAVFVSILTLHSCLFAQVRIVQLSTPDYEDKVRAVWTAQMLGAIMGFPFEHKVASTEWIHSLPHNFKQVPVDDDWYYEMVAINAFERWGTGLTVQQLGEQWIQNTAGTWGSSEQARLLMQRGIVPPHCGEPRYNRLWFSIGPQFSCDVYGALAPGLPNVAGAMARTYGHINGYAEGADGGVFVAGMVSLGFVEEKGKDIVKKAAQLIHPASPYRQCLDMVIRMAEAGAKPAEVFDAVERRWHIEYPATNNAVANGGIVAACIWFGEDDFLKTVNLAFGAADFTDADCNAANAGAVIGAIHGMKGLPQELVKALGDSIVGDKMGKLPILPAVHESISNLAKRTATVGYAIMKGTGVKTTRDSLDLPVAEVKTQPAELFQLSDLTKYWNPEWTLERAGFGGAGGGMPGIRGITYLDSNVLATYPRDEVKGVVLRRTASISGQQHLSFSAGVDSGRVWQCVVFAGNTKLYDKVLEGTASDRSWYQVKADLSSFRGKSIQIRIYQRVLLPGKTAGNAYWKDLVIE